MLLGKQGSSIPDLLMTIPIDKLFLAHLLFCFHALRVMRLLSVTMLSCSPEPLDLVLSGRSVPHHDLKRGGRRRG